MVAVSLSGAPLAVSDVLRIAEQDAQAVYRDLSGFKITLRPCPDGWHVDYDLTQPLSAGGGPHYVIDPHTGAILARRYEQGWRDCCLGHPSFRMLSRFSGDSSWRLLNRQLATSHPPQPPNRS